ncbi:hypothetical protein ACFV03_51040 [Streptomyces mirabilis]|uniref:hypothetical protein n=1 Tax=Streptomyces mirabilis TaxID=68239 RepID=UPI00368983D9
MDAATGLTQRDLEDRGFSGFIAFERLPDADVPDESGIYVVLRPSLTAPGFLNTSPAGWRGHRDPTVRTEQLAAKWVQGAHIVYIGKADAGAAARHGLRGRLRQYGRSGVGSSGHWGGRYIWQLRDFASLLVAWRTTAETRPAEAEADLIDEFILCHGRPPFANLRRGSRI